MNEYTKNPGEQGAAQAVQAAALLAFGLARARRQFAVPGPEKP